LTVPSPQPGRPSLRRSQPSPPVSLEPGEYADDICDEVAAAARACIAEKGSFSLCIPGGSVVAALAQMPADAFDASKVHLFFANEKIPSYPCKEGGLDAAKKLGVCPDVWRRFPEMYPIFSEIFRDYPSWECVRPPPVVRRYLLTAWLLPTGVPEANVHAFGEGEPAAVAESYSSLLASHASIDNSGESVREGKRLPGQ